MDAVQMGYEFLLGYNKIASDGAPGYNKREISTMLTEAQAEEVRDILSIYGVKYVKGFDVDAKITRYIDELVDNYNATCIAINPVAANKRNGIFVSLPTNHFYSLQEETISNINGNTCEVVADNNLAANEAVLRYSNVKPVTYDMYNQNIENPFRKPYKKLVWRLVYNTNQYELITDGTYKIYKYILRYLRNPRPIIIQSTEYNNLGSLEIDGYLWSAYSATSLDCQLHESFHRNIIARAITKATAKNLDANAYQILSADNMKQE
jgi:hypothetical protein